MTRKLYRKPILLDDLIAMLEKDKGPGNPRITKYFVRVQYDNARVEHESLTSRESFDDKD